MGWWNSAWTKRRVITISGNHPENYQLCIDLPFYDPSIRFLENEDSGELPYWIESTTSNSMRVWVKRSISNSGDDHTIYVYYGNPDASSISDFFSVFTLTQVGTYSSDNYPFAEFAPIKEKRNWLLISLENDTYSDLWNKVWDVSTGQYLGGGTSYRGKWGSWSGNANYFAVGQGGSNTTNKVYRTSDWTLVANVDRQSYDSHPSFKAESFLVSVYWYDGSFKIWRMSDWTAVRSSSGSGKWRMNFSPDYNRAALWWGSDLTIWDTSSNDPNNWSITNTLTGAGGYSDWSPDGSELAVAVYNTQTVKVFNTSNWSLKLQITRSANVRHVALGSFLIAVADANKSVGIYSKDGTLITTLSYSYDVNSVDFNIVDQYLAVATSQPLTYVYKIREYVDPEPTISLGSTETILQITEQIVNSDSVVTYRAVPSSSFEQIGNLDGITTWESVSLFNSEILHLADSVLTTKTHRAPITDSLGVFDRFLGFAIVVPFSEALALTEEAISKNYLNIPRIPPTIKVVNETSSLEVTEDVIRLRISKSRGLVTDWEIELAKPDLYTSFFNTGDTVKIYLGWEDILVNVCSGFCYSKNVSEDSITLKGFDFGDYLVGPNVSVEFYDEDWGNIIKRLISLYAPVLDVSEIGATGYKSGGRTIFENTTLLDAVLTAVDGLRLSSNTDWMLEVTPELKVRLIRKPLESTITVDEEFVESASYSKDQSVTVNRVVITGEKERIYDDFDTAFLKEDFWRAEAGANYWVSSGPPNYDLYYLGSNASGAGQLFTTIKCFNCELSLPVKQSVVSSSSPFDFSIYLRTEIGQLDTLGYRVRMYGPDSQNKHWVYLYKNGQLVASVDLSTLSTPLSYTADTYYLVNIKLERGSLSVSIKEQPVIEYHDPEPLTLGKVCLLAPAGKDTTIDYFRLDTDTPIWAMAEDIASQEQIGIKQVTLNMPEVCLIKEAERMASLELAKRKFESMRVELTALGNLRIGIGDVITLELPEPEISGDYLILDQEHTYEEGHWTTKYNLAMVMPRLVEILAGLRTAYLKKVPTTGMPRNARLIDTIPTIIDTIKSIYVEGANKVGESAVGVSYEYA